MRTLIAGLMLLGAAVSATAQPPRTDGYGDPLPSGAVARLGTIRNRAQITSFGVRADDTVVTVGGNDGVVELRLWAAGDDTGTEPRPLKTDKGEKLYQAAVSADGKRIAASAATRLYSPTTRLVVWDIAADGTARQVAAFDAESPENTRFLADNSAVVFSRRWGNDQRVVCLGDIKSGTILTLTGVLRYVAATAISADGKRVAASTGAEVHVWDATTGVLLARHELGELLPSAIALDPTGRILAVNPGAPAVNPDKERTVELLDAVTGKPVEKLTGPKGGQWVAFAPDGKTLLVGDAAGVRWWNPAAGKLIRAFEGFEDRLRYGGHEFPAARFSADGKMLVTASYRALHRWDAATGKPLFAETHGAGHFAEVTALGISADGKRIATAGPDERLRVWDAANGKPLLNVPAHMGFAVNLEFSPDGKSVYAGSGRFALAQWDIATGKELRRFTLGPKLEQILTNGPGLAGFHVSADGKQLLAVHNGRGFDPLPWMTNWNTEIGERTGSVELEQHWPLAMRRYRVQFSPDGKFATTGGNAFPTAQGPQGNTLGERVLGPGYEAGAFSGDGTLIAYWTNEERGNRFNIKVAVVYNPITGRKVAQLPDDSGGRLALSPDGKILVSANGDDLCFWDVFAGERIARYKGPAADRAYHVVSFAEVIWFSPDGTYVVTGNSDSTALVWRVPERPKK